MKGLILKDIYLVLKSISWVYLFPIAIIIVCAGSNITFLLPIISMIIPIFFGFFVNNTLYADEQSHWNRYSRALPLSISTVVTSKYVLGGLLLLCGSFFSLIVCVILAILGSIPLKYALSLVLLGLMLSIVYVSVLIPAVYKFGISKGPVIFIGLISILVVIPIGLNSLGINIDTEALLSNIQLISVLAVIGSAAIVLISFNFTKKILSSKAD